MEQPVVYTQLQGPFKFSDNLVSIAKHNVFPNRHPGTVQVFKVGIISRPNDTVQISWGDKSGKINTQTIKLGRTGMIEYRDETFNILDIHFLTTSPEQQKAGTNNTIVNFALKYNS